MRIKIYSLLGVISMILFSTHLIAGGLKCQLNGTCQCQRNGTCDAEGNPIQPRFKVKTVNLKN